MRVYNMESSSGKEVPNQFIIEDGNIEYFQSYRTIISKITNEFIDGNEDNVNQTIQLDTKAWNCSNITAKYRNKFLGMTTKEVKQAIKDGAIELVDLNGGVI